MTLAFSQCPNTQVVMSGYSQGAQVVHLAAADLPAATMAKVSAVVTYGDPGSLPFLPPFLPWPLGIVWPRDPPRMRLADFLPRPRHPRCEHRR